MKLKTILACLNALPENKRCYAGYREENSPKTLAGGSGLFSLPLQVQGKESRVHDRTKLSGIRLVEPSLHEA